MTMKRVVVSGKVLNQRTKDMLEAAEARLGYRLNVLQGSYNQGGVSASAGTHDGGGAVDVSATSNPAEVVRALRSVGFAAWHRLPLPGVWGEHIHAIAIGDAEMSSGARNQVTQYLSGLNGLANRGRDEDARVSPIPTWPLKLASVNFVTAKFQWSRKNPKPSAVVRKIQTALNERGYGPVKVDGVAGPKTKATYKAFEVKRGLKKADGVVNVESLKLLVAGFYKFRNVV